MTFAGVSALCNVLNDTSGLKNTRRPQHLNLDKVENLNRMTLYRMRVLELFSGTGSVGGVCKRLGCEVVSLDRDMEADIRTDIMDWDYRSYPPGSFDVIWSSPPCTEYSRAKTIGVRKLDEANGIVKRTLEIIEYFRPTYWIMENPQTGLLKSQPFIADLPYNDLDYCKYGMLALQKADQTLEQN